jgi:hypothetical protein
VQFPQATTRSGIKRASPQLLGDHQSPLTQAPSAFMSGYALSGASSGPLLTFAVRLAH